MLNVGKLSYCRESIIGRGAFGTVFEGLFEGTKAVAVKRIQKSCTSDDELFVAGEIDLMQQADHPNILRILCYEKNDDFIFIGTELCTGTLQDLVEGKYQGPAFENERDMLRQLTLGLAYLHNLEFVHRDIKPTNILIFLLDKPQIKLAGFGLCRILKPNNRDFTNTNLTRPSGTEGWIAPELYRSMRYDYKVDIFPLGCIFGYVLSGGKHPFGDHPIKRSFMIMEKMPIQMTAEDLKEPYSYSSVALELIKSMVDMIPARRPTAVQVLEHPFFNISGCFQTLQGNKGETEVEDPIFDTRRYNPNLIIKQDANALSSSSRVIMKVSQNLSYDSRHLIGRGAFSNVYFGHFKTIPVAVKRFQKSDTGDDRVIEREAEILEGLNHDNVLHYICMEKNDDFLFIVTELGDATLQDMIEELYSGPPLVVDEKEILHQVTKGLQYLHGRDIVHRDIKPTNILVFGIQSGKPQVKLADFGLSRVVNRSREEKTGDITNSNPSSPRGTRGWIAPELYMSSRYDSKADIFPLGCVFAYTLTGGQHPFGNDQYERMIRVKTRKPMLLNRKNLKKPFCDDSLAYELIEAMVKMNPSERPSVELVLNNEFFLTQRTKFDVIRSTMLLNICRSNSYESLEDTRKQLLNLIMDEGVDVNVNTVYGWTPLHFLCQSCQWENLIEILHFLLKRDVDVNVKTMGGWSPLHILCKHYKNSNLIEIAHLLIERGVDLNAKTTLGWTPMHLLCQNYKNDNLIVLVKLFMENGIDINTRTLDEESNVLHLLCQYYQNDNLIDIASLLVAEGADVNAASSFGFTPIHFLCENYKNSDLIDIIRLLIDHGADVNAKTLLKWNALHFLCQNYRCNNLIDIVSLLIQSGIDINTETSLGWNALHFLCNYLKKYNLTEIVLLLLRKGIDVKATTTSGWNALHLLCQNYENDNMLEVVQILIKWGIDINAKTLDDGWNPLQLLCKYYQNDNLIDIVQLLVENGIDSDAKNAKGWTASYILQSRELPENKIGGVLEILRIRKQNFPTFLFKKVKKRK